MKLYFIYTYNCGGLADMIKGSSTVWYIAKQTGRQFDIQFKHELGILYMSKLLKVKCDVLNLIDCKKSDGLFEKIQTSDRDIGIVINTTLDFFDKIPNYLEIISEYMRSFYRDILPLKKSIPSSEPFQVLHCRMGDVYLNESTNRSDNRIGSVDALNNKIAYFLKNMNTMRTLICCDNSSVQQQLLDKIPNSFTVNTTPYHFAYNTRKIPQTDIIASIELTLAEHEYMSRAERIIKCAYSGFPIIAAVIGSKSLFILKEDGCVPYISCWTPSHLSCPS